MSYFIGIDIGGTNLRADIILKEEVIDIFKTANEVSSGDEYNSDKLVDYIKNKWKVYEFEKVGVGAPGLLDLKAGKPSINRQ